MFRWGLVWTGLIVVAAGCGPLQPPHAVNAHLLGNVPVERTGLEPSGNADTVLLAKCTESQEYATTTSGDWVNSWYVTTWSVLRVERGKWPEDTLSFIFCDRWRPAKLGILSNKAATPYYAGAVRAFYLDTRRKPTIVADQVRSRIPPHGNVTRAEYDVTNSELRLLHERVGAAARDFVQNARGVTGPSTVSEQYGRSFVVEVEAGKDSLAVVVNGETLAVRWADPNDAAQ